VTLPPGELAALSAEYARLQESCARIENLLLQLIAVLNHERPPQPPAVPMH
jgi:hypothetical protein